MPEDTTGVSPKSYGVAVALSMIFGIVGVHHFYMGNWLHGLLDFGMFVVGFTCIVSSNPAAVSLGMLVIIIDVLHTIWVTYRLIVGKCRDGRGLLITFPGQVR